MKDWSTDTKVLWVVALLFIGRYLFPALEDGFRAMERYVPLLHSSSTSYDGP